MTSSPEVRGRDLLIGGTGADDLEGDQADDIIIAGNTRHDEDSDALTSIRNVWNSGQSYSARVNALLSTSLRADIDVFDDAVVDTLRGDGGQDWFIFNADSGVRDVVTDLKKDDMPPTSIPPVRSPQPQSRFPKPRQFTCRGFSLH